MLQIKLTDEQRQERKEQARQAVGRVSERVHFVLLNAQGYSAPTIGQMYEYEIHQHKLVQPDLRGVTLIGACHVIVIGQFQKTVSTCQPLYYRIRRIADFLAIEIADQALAQVVETTSLDARRQRAVAAEAEADKPRIWHDGIKTFFNKGATGCWQGMLTEAELAMYEQT